MQRAKRLCFYCLHKVWLALAIVLVLLAVSISVLRYSLPYADNYKHHIEQLISDRYNAEVSIGSLSAGWQKFGPALLLQNLKLHDSEQTLQLQIAETRVRLDFWRSLLARQLKAQHFELSGLTYYVDADSVLTPDSKEGLDTAPVLAALETLFFQQLTYFSVLDSQLVLQNDGAADLTLHIKQLDWANSGNRHQGYGELALAGVTANTVSFVLDLYGPSLSEAFGQLYLQSNKLDVLPWFASVLPPSQKLQQASINFQAWGRIDQGLLRRMQVELANNSISWQRQGKTQKLQLGQGQLLWQPTTEGWSLYSGDLTLSADGQQWPGLQLQLHRDNGKWQASLNQFALAAVTPLAQLLAEDIAPLQQLMQYQPVAELSQLQWLSSGAQWQLSGEFSQLSSVPVRDVPGLNKVAGDFVISAELARLRLHSAASQLSWDTLFNVATDYDSLSASLYWQAANDDQHWRLSIPQLQLTAGGMQLDASLQLDDTLQILAQVQQADASQAERFFPAPYMPEQVRSYLQQAIVAGTVSKATLLWHGKPAEYPYRQQQGVFQVLAQLDDGQFAFDPHWPLISGLSAELLFDNASMRIQSNAGDLSGIALQQAVRAEINDLFAADSLDIHIRQTLDAAMVTALMLQSPLADNLGKTLTHLGVSGQVQGDVKLAIGLKQRAVLASGQVELQDASMSLQAPKMQLDKLQGKLRFNNEQINADQLSMHWRGLPITAALQGENGQAGYQLALQLQGEQPAKQLAQALHAPAAELLDGTTNWQLQLALSLPQQGFSYSAQLFSDLQGTALKLPAPYSKAAVDSSALTLYAKGDAQRSLFNGHLDNNLHVHAELQHDSQQISRMHLIAAEQDSGINGAGFAVSIDLAEADFISWFSLLQQQIAATTHDHDHQIMPPLSKVQGKIRQLQAAPGVTLNNTVFELNQLADSWQLQLNGTEIASRWQINKNLQQGISAELDYLHLPWPQPAVTADPATPQHWWLQLPPLTVRCADCSVGPYRLGQVSASARSSDEQWQLTQFDASYKRSNLSLSGFWQPDTSLGHTELSGRASSNNIGSLLQEFQITSAISGSSAETEFTLGWQGAPNQFALEQLSGQVAYQLGDGSLTEVSDQGARLFSIFSLDSLLRKLRLDFRDVFAKGFFYNGMSGNLAIAEGVVHTSNAAIDGVPGNLQIQGYADLVSRDMDYQMAFSPKVTSSLPIIIAWMVNPATGLAALALDEVFQSAEVISKINFTVTGSFDKPVVTEVNRHSKQVPVPVRVAQPEAIIEPPAVDPSANPEQQPHGE
ncbi:MAG: TIGR02099 family protein [Gammaproteobacteria bacterium]|nr:TIGR02099 family protein [Gammaproteobacteria bacterium]